MDKKLYLCFIWHQHQPYYKDPSGTYVMPWVFLHAIKDYYEMVWLLENKSIKATFNLVSSLIVQLKEYENKSVNDRFLNTLRKHPNIWDIEEKKSTVNMLFSSNRATMVAPIARYNELYTKKENFTNQDSFISELSEQDILDLSVCFLLSWCGNAARQKVDIVKKLLAQGRSFTFNQLQTLLDALFDFVSLIINYHKINQENGKIEIATTPFYHPILPILLDKNAPTQAYSDCIMPKHLSDFSDDAIKHVESSIKLYNQTFGVHPKGFWPAEGSISVKALTLMAKNGIKWAASDEDVLFKTVRNNNRFDLYKRHSLITQDGEISILFRDKKLSDLIGFAYSTKDANESAKDFVSKLREIYDNVGFSPLVNVILDGENAWEFYQKNGLDFFIALYSLIENQDWIETLFANETIQKEDIPKMVLGDLKPGSWIYGTFSTWIGQEQKNRAWELLSVTKEFVKNIQDSIDEKLYAEIEQNLMIAEGSDWFWWYGDDHFTPQAAEFDALFRLRLINIFRLANQVAPAVFYEPIVSLGAKPKYKKPSTYISPDINGDQSDYYEWLGCGYVELGAELAAMDSSGFYLTTLYWGFNEKNVYFGLDGKISELVDSGYTLVLGLALPYSMQIELPFSSEIFSQNLTINSKTAKVKSCAKRYFEIGIDRALFGTDKAISVSFEIVKDDKLIERTPRYGALELEIDEKLMDDWFI